MKLRTKFFIMPKFQVPLLLASFLVIVIFTIAIVTAYSISFAGMVEIGRQAGLQEGNVFFSFLENQRALFLQQLIFYFLLAILLSFVIIVFISHRLAGPLVRLHIYFTQLQDFKGDVPKISFRKNDYLNDLADKINRAVDNLVNKNRH